MTYFTGRAFWNTWIRKNPPRYRKDVYIAVQNAWNDAWTHADGSMCEKSVWDAMVKPSNLSQVCAVLTLVQIEGVRR